VPLKRSVSGRFDYDISLGAVQNQRHKVYTGLGPKSPLSTGWTSPAAAFSSHSGGGPNTASSPSSLKDCFNESAATQSITTTLKRPGTLSLDLSSSNQQLSFSAPNEAALILGPSTPMPTSCSQNLLVNFEESMLNGRIHPVGQVDGFELQVGASGCGLFPKHQRLPMQAYFFHLSDDNAPSPYLGFVDLKQLRSKRGYHIPRKGSLQLTLFNPSGAVVKMFLIVYDFEDMPPNCQTFLRQRTVYMPISPGHTQLGTTGTSSEEESFSSAPQVDYSSFSSIVTPSTSSSLRLSAAADLDDEMQSSCEYADCSGRGQKRQRKQSFTTTRSGANLPIIDRPWTIGLNSVYEGGFHAKSLRKMGNVQTAARSSLPANLRYSIHLRFHSGKTGRVYLHTDIRMIFSRDKFEFDPSVAVYELKSFIDAPSNPRYSPKK
ncbi:hypothetical protein Ciccas_013426, partial [Cichlidogyrus casuarinus]